MFGRKGLSPTEPTRRSPTEPTRRSPTEPTGRSPTEPTGCARWVHSTWGRWAVSSSVRTVSSEIEIRRHGSSTRVGLARWRHSQRGWAPTEPTGRCRLNPLGCAG
ncbi:hypothetical protein E1263_28630 [Kribbella antibiotica]|uniref:Uncharacterized protein n=1 Tax=Kribbella antibiotica TaxID=190195 RepID=A0A4R4Z4I0_9ACTN|nr:hypothetical protein E1263_28630 [Kribbella antibiotica]